MAEESSKKKQVPLRISDTLFKELSAWAADDFRSLNGQIEFLLTECVKKRKRQNGPLHKEQQNKGTME
jgi:hypothetical protein